MSSIDCHYIPWRAHVERWNAMFMSHLDLFGPRSTFLLFHPSLPTTRSLLLETRALHYLCDWICFKFSHHLFKQKIRTELRGCVYLVHKNFYPTIFILATQVCITTLSYFLHARFAKIVKIWILNTRIIIRDISILDHSAEF